MNHSDIAYQVWKRYELLNFSPAYTTILTCYGALRLAEVTGDDALYNHILEKLSPFWNGEVPTVVGHYGQYDYRWGGNAAAWACRNGRLPAEAEEKLTAACDDLLQLQPRYENGIFCQRKWHDREQWGFRWIDTVFGVCPFLLWMGLKCNRQDYIDEAAAQMRYHHELLFDPVRKLYHQAVDARRPEITPGYWSRGVGWGLHALADLVADLPEEHPDYPLICRGYTDVMDGCLASQDEEGMWHQSMDDFGTFPESSGTGLILYALGKGIRTGFFRTPEHLEAFTKGIQGLSGYICLDGSVQNCCGPCCCPGYNGTAADYQNRGWILNDHHAFGSPLLALAEAAELQKKEIL